VTALLESLESRRLLSGWGTVDDFQNGSGQPPAHVEEMTADAYGNVYAVGYASDRAGIRHGIVREKLGGTANWETILDLPPLPGTSGVKLSDVAANPAGDVYVSGSDSSSSFIVLKRSAGLNSSFSIVDNIPATASYDGGGLTIDATGNVFAIARIPVTITTAGPGKKTTTTTEVRSVVRKQTGGAGAFVTLPQYLSIDLTAMCSIASGPSAGLYAVGNDARGGSNWVVWKSANAGSTWSQVDSFSYNSASTQAFRSYANGVCGDLDGNVYVTGGAVKLEITGGSKGNPTYTPVFYLTTRRSNNGGAAWTVDDSYTLGLGGHGYDVGIDPAGNVYVAGEVSTTSPSVYHSIVRQKLRGSTSWSTIDDFISSSGTGNTSHCFTADSSGNLFAGGMPGNDPTGFHWIVRSGVPAAPAPAMATFSGSQIAGSTTYPDRLLDLIASANELLA
jgi:hypothetical protein